MNRPPQSIPKAGGQIPQGDILTAPSSHNVAFWWFCLGLCLFLVTKADAQTDFARPTVTPDFSVDTRGDAVSTSVVTPLFDVDTRDSGSAIATTTGDFDVSTMAVSPMLVSTTTETFPINTRAGMPAALAVHGIITSTTEAAVRGASIEIKIYGQAWWRGVSGPDGSFYPPEMKAQNYVVIAQKPGYVTLAKNVVGAAGGIRSLPLVMQPLSAPPPTQTVVRQATNKEKNDPAATTPEPQAGQPETQLMIYASGQWKPVGAVGSPVVNPNAMIIVLSHGWWPIGIGHESEVTKWPINDWPLQMAFLASQNNTLATAPNIFAWDWHNEATSVAPWPGRASKQGELLGKALRRRLGINYNQHVHFIGHSMGTLVDRFACDVAHQRGTMNWGEIGWNSDVTKPHMTLLDEAELASVLGTRVITSATIGAITSGWYGALRNAAVTAYEDWKSPIPATPTALIDSYISMVGIQRAQAVNVCLTTPAIAFENPIDAHAYAHLWYRNSAHPPFSPRLGFPQSYERGGVLPPSGYGLAAGNLWFENLATPDLLDLSLDPNPTSLECNISIIGTYSIQTAATIGKVPLDATLAAGGVVIDVGTAAGNKILDTYQAGINWAGDLGGTAIIKTQQAYTTTKEKIGEGWDAAKDTASEIKNSLNPTRLIDGISRSVFQIHLGGGGSSGGGSSTGGYRVARNGTPTPTEPGAWLSLAVPENTAMMQFDFTVNGPPVDDCIAAAVGGQNVFNLPARFAPAGEVQSTDLMDISAYAGQTVEFYFGLVGRTSTECELVVDGLRFVTIPQPPLVLENHDTTVSLHWPSAASGWRLEASDSLTAGSWQLVEPSVPSALTTSGGVNRLEEARPLGRQFYRLHRVP